MKNVKFDERYIIRKISFVSEDFEVKRSPFLTPTSYDIIPTYNTRYNILHVIQLKDSEEFGSVVEIKLSRFRPENVYITIDIEKGTVIIDAKEEGCTIKLNSQYRYELKLSKDKYGDTCILYIIYK